MKMVGVVMQNNEYGPQRHGPVVPKMARLQSSTPQGNSFGKVASLLCVSVAIKVTVLWRTTFIILWVMGSK